MGVAKLSILDPTVSHLGDTVGIVPDEDAHRDDGKGAMQDVALLKVPLDGVGITPLNRPHLARLHAVMDGHVCRPPNSPW